ncbi:MAG: hypothetical protein GY943_18495 [Chloroflexi bacterium]|nr:hypothetical protein [Chloroflexota bacterium]
MMGLTTSSILVISKKISGKYIAGILAIISVPFLRMMIHGQPEIFPLWGVFSSSFLLSPLLLLVKPQSAFFAILGRIKSNPTIMLTTFVLAISALYTIEFGNVNKFNQNISLWPYGLIIGLPLLIKSLRDGDVLIGAIATYFVAPYVITHSVVVPLFAFYLRWPKWSIPMWIFVWYVLTSNS